MSVSQSEADVIFNRANVALARSQRLVASWLPPKTAEELANAKSEEELQREEDEIFTPVPEKYVFIKALPFIATFVLFYSFFLFLIPGSGTTDRLFFFSSSSGLVSALRSPKTQTMEAGIAPNSAPTTNCGGSSWAETIRRRL